MVITEIRNDEDEVEESGRDRLSKLFRKKKRFVG